jgi:hypothetical protein
MLSATINKPEILESKLDKLEADAPIALATVDFDVTNPELLRQEFGHVFHYFGRVEGEVAMNTNQLSALLPNADEHTKRFIGIWKGQEIQHGMIFDNLQTVLGLEPAVVDPNAIGNSVKLGGEIAKLPKMHDVFMMLYLSRGAMHERLTAGGYKSLEKQLLTHGEVALVETALKPIQHQEAGHLGYYQSAALAKRRELAPWQLGLARKLTHRLYLPVGVGNDEQAVAFTGVAKTLAAPDIAGFVQPVQRVANKLLENNDEVRHHRRIAGHVLRLLKANQTDTPPNYVLAAVENLANKAA